MNTRGYGRATGPSLDVSGGLASPCAFFVIPCVGSICCACTYAKRATKQESELAALTSRVAGGALEEPRTSAAADGDLRSAARRRFDFRVKSQVSVV